jgi:outer membrane protein OmpA-like peptidoglycan-associated protein
MKTRDAGSALVIGGAGQGGECRLREEEDDMTRDDWTATLALMAFCLSIGAASARALPAAPESLVVTKSTKAVGYQVGGGSTRVDLKGTELMPNASGEAKVEAKSGVTTIEVEVKRLWPQPTKLGAELLTYVLWVVSPDGRTGNLGELLIDKDGEGKLSVTSQSQTFSLIVTAEPYLSVRQPSEMVVLENAIRKDTKGKIFVIDDYRLMKRGQYERRGNPLALKLDLEKIPLEVYEARSAIDIARSRDAEKYAAEIFTKAAASLQMTENALAKRADRKTVVSTARQAIQFSEDARALAVQRQEEERIAQEREAAAAKAKAEAEAKAAAEAAEAKARADAEAQRQAELAAAKEAALRAEAQRQADLAAAKEAAMKAEARHQAELAAAQEAVLKEKEEAAKADAERARQQAEQLRAQLLEQFNRILDTKDTPRGLVVNMGDVLFDVGKYDLRPEAREKLAKLSGIVLAHSGLRLDVEGYTDNTGSDELNQALSERRAETVRRYLVEQGLAEGNVTAKGLGKAMPVAENDTAAGRQKNRRVEIIVSGEVIGMKIGA